MSLLPKPSRMEKQVRNLSRGLFWVSAILLVVCMAMTGLFGWSIGTDLANRIALAIGYGASDAAGALFWAGSGVCFAWRARGVGLLTLLFGAICFAVSLSAVIGFQSANREAIAQARERASGMSAAYLDWTKTAVTDAVAKEAEKSNGKGRPVAGATPSILATGIEAVGREVKEQMRLLQSGEVAGVADGQAFTLARVLGIEQAQARSWAIFGGSAALLLIQYGVLWLYGFLRHRIEPAVVEWSAANAARGPYVESGESAAKFKPKFTKEQARADIVMLTVTGQLDKMGVRGVEMAKRWGVSPATAGNYLREFGKGGLIQRARTGERNSLAVKAARPAHVNGNGAAIAGNA